MSTSESGVLAIVVLIGMLALGFFIGLAIALLTVST
jgi:hypothetical protein